MSVMVFLSEPKKSKIDMFYCTFCKQSFYYERYLKRHVKRMHDVTPRRTYRKLHKCNLCEKSFSSKSYMYKHSISAHGSSMKRKSIKCQEENCHSEFSTMSKFRLHLDSIHNFEDYNVPEKLRFNSLADYIEWLVQEEQNTKCKFIRPRGRFKTTLYTGIDYICSLNKHFFSKSSSERSQKIQDPKKTMFHCTAQISVKEFDDHVEALYFKRHYKHDFFFNIPKLLIRKNKTREVEKQIDNTIVHKKALSLDDKQFSSENADIGVAVPSLHNDEQCSSESVDINLTTTSLINSSDKQYSSESVGIDASTTLLNSSSDIEHLLEPANIGVTTTTLNCSSDTQYLKSGDNDITTTLLNRSNNLSIESLIKQLDSISSKLLSKTSLDIHVALKISKSLEIVEQLLNDDVIPCNLMTSCKLNETNQNSTFPQKKLLTIKKKCKTSEDRQFSHINVSVNKVFISTSPENDHDYNKT